MAADVVAFLVAAFGRVEELARALPPGPWRWVEVDGEGGEYEALWGVDGKAVLASSDTEEYKSWIYRHDGFDAFLSLVQPVSVLRRVKADRAILAEHTDQGARECTVCAPVDWDAEERPGRYRYPADWPCRTVRLLAEAWGWEAA